MPCVSLMTSFHFFSPGRGIWLLRGSYLDVLIVMKSVFEKHIGFQVSTKVQDSLEALWSLFFFCYNLSMLIRFSAEEFGLLCCFSCPSILSLCCALCSGLRIIFLLLFLCSADPVVSSYRLLGTMQNEYSVRRLLVSIYLLQASKYFN